MARMRVHSVRSCMHSTTVLHAASGAHSGATGWMRCRLHVPYRNSLMTLVLRDSLGGNCKTAMVATISGDAAQMEESISTCRFAQRVAMVTNEVRVGRPARLQPGNLCCRQQRQQRWQMPWLCQHPPVEWARAT